MLTHYINTVYHYCPACADKNLGNRDAVTGRVEIHPDSLPLDAEVKKSGASHKPYISTAQIRSAFVFVKSNDKKISDVFWTPQNESRGHDTSRAYVNCTEHATSFND